MATKKIDFFINCSVVALPKRRKRLSLQKKETKLFFIMVFHGASPVRLCLFYYTNKKLFRHSLYVLCLLTIIIDYVVDVNIW